MQLQNVLLGIGVGFLIANALPHDGANSQPREAPPKADGLREIDERELGAPAHLERTIGSPPDNHTGLYVPLFYAGYVASDGTYARYQCDANDKKDKSVLEDGKKGSINPAGIVTDNIWNSLVIHIISNTKAIMVHIPFDVRDVISGVKPPKGQAVEEKTKRQAALIETAAKKLKKIIKKEKVTVVVIVGPKSNGEFGADFQAVTNMFKLRVDRVFVQEYRGPGNKFTTAIDISDTPKLWNELSEVPLSIPD